MRVNLFDYRFLIPGLYLVLLSASYAQQTFFPKVPGVNKYEKAIYFHNTEAGTGSAGYYEVMATNLNSSVPLLLFPDIYYDAEFLLPLAEKLASDRTVIIPLYPGDRNT